MKPFTADLLAQVFAPTPRVTCALYAPYLETTCQRYGISTVARRAALLGQMGIECARLTRMSENMNYRDPQRLDDMFSAVRGLDDARALIKAGPQSIANRVYANRLGNGDEASGDGWRHRGAGGIGCTGKTNQAAFGAAIGMPLAKVPAYLLTPEGAMLVTGWFWDAHHLNPLADAGDIDAITRVVNGPAMAAAAERRALTVTARKLIA
jgi:putative chitinase